VAVWVGPGNAVAKRGAEELLEIASPVGRAPGAEVQGIEVDRVPTIGDLIIEVDGVETRVVERGGEPRRELLTQVRFTKLDLLPRLMHTVASPAVAYLLLLVGMVLIVFELYTAGIGVAGVVGAGSLVLAAFGLDVLPVNAAGLALLVVSMLAFAIDVQTGVPRFWTAVGVVTLVAGSLLLYDDPVSLSWLPLAVGVVGTVLMMLAGMPSIVRARFSTPTIGREGMIGELGEAVQDVRPDGVVRVREALWRARTNRATPIAEGDPVRVIGIDGLLLEVEPEEGGARDYRERRARS
jgi:membrane-bound serine protease (ClpP class)